MPHNWLKRADVGSTARRSLLLPQKARHFQAAFLAARRQDGVVVAFAVAASWISDVAVRPLTRHRQQRFDDDRGVETGASPTVAAQGSAPTRYQDNVRYVPTPIRQLEKLFDLMAIDPRSFSFVDLGCGKGGTLLIAAEYGYKTVVGVEFDRELAEIARQNIAAFTSKKGLNRDIAQIFCEDAADYSLPGGSCVVFMFNPFGEKTMRAVVRNIETSVRRTPGQVYIAYLNPVERHVLDSNPGLKKVSRHPPRFALYEMQSVGWEPVTSPQPAARPYDHAKRVIDVLLSSIALFLTAPVQAVLAFLVVKKLGRPILFRQRRPGLHGRPFTLVKFRTMHDADPEAGLVTDSDRVTPFGMGLRRASLDELPTLWNVLRGDMSMIGPRPLMMQYLDRYTPQQTRRHEVRPGITGLAQVSGRNALTWEQKFAADVEYVDRRSLFLDTRIAVLTVSSVTRRRGISAPGDVTMPEFFGTADAQH